MGGFPMWDTGMRRYHRYQVFTKAVVTVRSREGSGRMTTQVNNISQGGIGLYIDVPLEKATPVSVELTDLVNESRTDAEPLKGRVASLSKQMNHYFMGIAFDVPISYDHLMKLLQWD
jgi:hypothetical protein